MMMNLKPNLLKRFISNKKGAFSIEMLLVAGVLVVLVVTSMNLFSYQAMKVNNTIANSIENAQNQYTPGP